MNRVEVTQLYEEGHDIGSHSMDHPDLSKPSANDLEFEIRRSKQCLEDHGIEVNSFAYPFNKGSSDKTVINIVAKYYDLARTAGSPQCIYIVIGGGAILNKKTAELHKKSRSFICQPILN